MQVRVHIPRSLIREAKRTQAFDPFDEAVTVAVGAPAYVGISTVGFHQADIPEIKLPRSARRAVNKFDWGILDKPVRFRLTIPEAKG